MKLLEVKAFQETLNSSYCGPAVLKMVLEYYGIEKEEEELAKLLKVDPKLGTNDKLMKEVAESFGFKAEIKNFASFEDIESWLEKEVPVIVDWFTKGRDDYDADEVASGHYSIVIFMDKEYIYLQDPEVGRIRTIKKEDFMGVWFDYTGLAPDSWENMIIRQMIVIYK